MPDFGKVALSQLGTSYDYLDVNTIMLYGQQITGNIDQNKNLVVNKISPSYGHTPIFIQDAINEITFKNIRGTENWILIGGADYTFYSAIRFGTDSSLRLADLGPIQRTKDIVKPLTIAVNDYVKMKWEGDILRIYGSKDNKLTWTEYASINMPVDAPTITNWIGKKYFGFVAYLGTTILASDIQVYGSISLANKVASNTQAITAALSRLGNTYDYFDLNTTFLYGQQVTSNIDLNRNLVVNRVTPTYNWTPIFIQNATNEITFKNLRDIENWILIGGTDYASFTTVRFGTDNSLRLADLALVQRIKDITVPLTIAVNDYVKMKWDGDILRIYGSKDSKLTWTEYASINMPVDAPTITNWVGKKVFGFVAYAGITTIASDIQVYGLTNLANTVAANSQAIKSLQVGIKNKLMGNSWNAVGDSITQIGKYLPIVADGTGLVVSNKGLSSSTIAVNNTYLTGQSMLERIQGYANADVWTVFGGVNDWYYLTPLGTMANTIADTTTFYGALKAICENILNRANNPHVVFFTPLQSNRNGANTNAVTMNQYRQAIKDVCDYYSIPVIDLYAIGGFSPVTLAKYTSDNVHPNDLGTSLYAPKIANFLNNLK